ncbi:MAG: DUF362 domain-containing protein [candidate division Zixibacteria bacterium]|nr:DUF362 domain-containing protein [candidate division Zixibacteria bacterium]
MSEKVYFIDSRIKKFDYAYSLQGRLEKVLEKIDLSKYFSRDELVPLKMHLGNRGGHHTLRPNFVRLVTEKLKEIGAKPFVTDSSRVKPYEYLEVANQMGYNQLSLGCPVIIADGIFGYDSIMVKAGKFLKELAVPSAIYDAKSMLVLTHVKGHIDSSYAGAIKNLAMGCVSRQPRGCTWKEGGRGKMHFQMAEIMAWDKKLCTYCAICANNCPVEAITIKKDLFEVNEEKCWRCGRCVKVCPEKALSVPQSHLNFSAALAEAAGAVLNTFEKGKVLYINFILDVQPECDCMAISDNPLIQDQGILIGDDIVAIETSTMDLIEKTAPLPQSKAEGMELKKGQDIFSVLHKKDARIQIKEAEKLGLGKSDYILEKI